MIKGAVIEVEDVKERQALASRPLIISNGWAEKLNWRMGRSILQSEM